MHHFRLLKWARKGRSKNGALYPLKIGRENAKTKMAGKTPKLKQYDMDDENGWEILCIVFPRIPDVTRSSGVVRRIRFI